MAASRHIDRLHSALTARYVVALALVAGLVTGNHFVAVQTVEREMQRAEIINLAGKQRMLTQRIAYFASDYAGFEDPEDRASSARELRKSAAALEAGHQFLLGVMQGPAIGAVTRESLESIFFDPASGFDSQIHQFLDRARGILEIPIGQVSLDHPQIAILRLMGSGPILQTHDMVVSILQTDSEEAVEGVQSLLNWLWIAALLLLVIEALFIFRPLIKRVGRHIRLTAEQSAAKARAEAGSAVKTNILRNLSHELRTPMNAILGHTMLFRHTQLTAEQRSMIGDMESSGHKLLDLINDMLSLTDLVIGDFDIREVPTNIRDVLTPVVKAFEGRAAAKGVGLTLSVDWQVPDMILMDASSMRQVITNILSNAIKFTDRGQIEIRLANRRAGSGPEFLWIEVEDTGCGIPKDRLPHIFKEFEQADASITRAHDGAGIGLSICRRIVELQGGRIGVESEEGQGTRFWFALPLREVECAPPNTSSTSPIYAGASI